MKVFAITCVVVSLVIFVVIQKHELSNEAKVWAPEFAQDVALSLRGKSYGEMLNRCSEPKPRETVYGKLWARCWVAVTSTNSAGLSQETLLEKGMVAYLEPGYRPTKTVVRVIVRTTKDELSPGNTAEAPIE